MNLSDSISAYCLWLFFLGYGLSAFVPPLTNDRRVGAVLALLFVLFSLLGM